MRLDESPFKEYQKKDFEAMLEDYNSRTMENKYPNAPKRVKIWDESLRDGEQSPGTFLKTNEKIELTKLLDEIGVDVIATGFPAVSKEELSIVKAIVQEGFKNASIAAVSRMIRSDIDAVLATECKEIIFFLPLSDLFLNLVIRKKREEITPMVIDALGYARDHGLNVSIVAEDASRAKIEHVLDYFRVALDNGASKLVYADTVGVLFPETMHDVVGEVIAGLNETHEGKFDLGVHVHDDFGFATANTIAAVLEGVVYPHVCINGYGERAGNAPLEEVVVALEMNGISTGLKLEKIWELAKTAEEYFGIPITSHKPIVGENSFSHESGIHVAAVLMHPMTYEPIPPKKIGRKRAFYLGKGSGIHSIQDKLAQVGMEFPRDILQDIVEKVKEKQEKKDKITRKKIFRHIMEELHLISTGVTDEEFWNIVLEQIRNNAQYKDQEKHIPPAKVIE